MTPSQQAKVIAGHNLQTVSAITGVSPQTLSNWAKSKPNCFYALLVGCKHLRLVDGEVLQVTGKTTQPKPCASIDGSE